MADVHTTAIIRGEVELAEHVTIGPGCVIDGSAAPITIGAGTRLVGNVYLCGPLEIGAGNTIYPFACLGFAPQSLDYEPSRPGCGLAIGDHNILREGVTIHRAMTDQGPSTVGDHNYFMANSHAGHDVRISHHCTFVNGALLGGHVIIDERVTVGGNTTVHQFCRIGRGAMLSGTAGTSRDVPPFFMLTAVNIAGSLNVIGMRRQGLSPQQIQDIRWVYKMLYRRNLPPSSALQELRRRAQRPMVAEYIEFIESSRRGLCPGHSKPKRNRGHT